jgi:ATP-binding cassette, subfamily B, bacterial PglK
LYLIINTIIKILRNNRKGELYGVMILMICLSLLELIGLGIIIPVVRMLSSDYSDNSLVMSVVQIAGLNNSEHAVYLLLGCLALFFLMKSVFSLFAVYKQQYFVNTVLKDVSVNIMKNTLNLSYESFISQDKSLYLKNIITSSNYLSLCAFNVLQLFTEVLVLVVITIFLGFYIGIEPLLYFSLFLIIFVLFFKIVTRNISKLGERRDRVMHDITKSATEALNGYREIKIDNVANKVTLDYENKIRPYIGIYSMHGMLSNIPRVSLETVAALLIVGYIFSVSMDGENISSNIEQLVVLAFVGLRLIPSLNKILTANANIKYFGTEVQLFLDVAKMRKTHDSSIDKGAEIVKFESALELKNVCYSYPNSDKPTVRNINLTIEKGKRYGLVGRSGSGKSTLFDLILGFTTPTSGKIILDGVSHKSFENLDMSGLIGLVPQSVFVLDATLKNNIVFFNKEFDEDKFNKALYGSQVLDFMESDTDKKVGESGSKLSGGQRQRLAIARSLYSSKEILLLDEATSALDNQTEKKFIKFLNESTSHTLLVIAHRLSTIRNCDKIFVMDKGDIVDEGTYEDLLLKCKIFKSMVKAGDNEK